MTAETGTLYLLMGLGLLWAAYLLISAGLEVWRKHKEVWWTRTDGDYLDLRPRPKQIGRRKL